MAGDGVHVEITGFEQLIGLINNLPAQIGGASNRGAKSWCYKVINTANSKYVPIKSGALVSSGKVVEIDGNTNGTGTTKLAIEYDRDYALDQHENQNYKHPNGGQAKYLEQAVEDHKDELTEMVAEELKAIGRGRR